MTAGARWTRSLAVVLLLGLSLAVALTAMAGARRTQSAYPRLLRWGNASTLSLTSGATDDPAVEAAVARLPQVVGSTTYVAFQTNEVVDGRPDFAHDFEPVGTLDGRYFTQDRFRATEGRIPAVDRADEVAVNRYAAQEFGYRVGQRLDLATYSVAQLDAPDFYAHPPRPVRRDRVTIVGIGLFPDEVLQDEGDRTTRMLMTPAFTRSAQKDVLYSLQGVVLRHGDRDIPAVKAAYAGLVPPGTSIFRVTSNDELHALGAVRPLSIALALFGAIAGVAGLLVTAQALRRSVRAERRELGVLRAVGAGPRDLATAMLVEPVLAIVAGTALALVVAVAASPLMPLGPVRRTEVSPGVDLDLTVLLAGAAVSMLTLSLVAVLAVRAELPHRIARRGGPSARSSRLVGAAAAAGARPSAVMGLRFALEPDEASSAVPVRSVIPSAAVAVIALTASLVFGTSLGDLVHRPVLYGWTWDATAFDANGYGNLDLAATTRVLAADRRVAAWSGAYFGTATMDGHDVPLLGMAPGAAVLPPVIEGRAPRVSTEVVLGSETAALLGARIGGQVTLDDEGVDRRLTVVGLAILPTVGIVHGAHTSLGVGALVAPALVPGVDKDLTTTRTGTFGPNAAFIRLRGVDRSHPPGAVLADIRRELAPAADFGGVDVFDARRPAEIVNSSAIGTSPALLAAALAVAALASLGLALAASVRRRVADLSLLKCLGFTRRQLAATVRWQATATISLSLLLGLPVGVAAGRWLWIRFARQLHVVPHPVVRPAAVLGVALLVLLVANLAAAIPARRAGRVGAAVRPSTD